MDRADEKRVGAACAPTRKPATPLEAVRQGGVLGRVADVGACRVAGAMAHGTLRAEFQSLPSHGVPLPLPAWAYGLRHLDPVPHATATEIVSTTHRPDGLNSAAAGSVDALSAASAVPRPLAASAYTVRHGAAVSTADSAVDEQKAVAQGVRTFALGFDDLVLALAVPLPMVPAAYAARPVAKAKAVAAAKAEGVVISAEAGMVPLPSVAAKLPPGLDAPAIRPSLDIRLLSEPQAALPQQTETQPQARPRPVAQVQERQELQPRPAAAPARAAPFFPPSHPVPSWPGIPETQTRPLVRQGPKPPFDLRPGMDAGGRIGAMGAAMHAPASTVHEEAGPADSAGSQGFGRYVRPALRLAGYAVAAWIGMILLLMAVYRFVNPPVSSLMLQQWLSGADIKQSWVALEEVSPQVVRAVLVSEDGRFCEHWGVDLDAMQDAIETAGSGGSARGASTISMQVVKNLFLWPSKSYVRKAIELPLTWLMELFWSKQRIMEVYLNIAEWGPGIFGVEEASRFHFNKGSQRLNEREAAQLAVALPNPFLRDAGDPGPKTRRLAQDIRIRMRNASRAQTACVLNGRR